METINSLRGAGLPAGAAGGPAPGLVGSPEGTTWQVKATLSVSYDVIVCADLFDETNDTLEQQVYDSPSARRLFIVEQHVHDLYGDRLEAYLKFRGLDARIVAVPADETAKDSDLGHRIVEALDDFAIDRRREPVVAVGGGVLLDVVGWVSGMYRRGTPYIRIPTTLIGLVDAGVGVKTAVNHNGKKNILGSYHPPAKALLDPAFLGTLPRRHISNGMAEIAKMGLVCDEVLWGLIASDPARLVRTALGRFDGAIRDAGQEIVSRAVHSMLAELQPNLWEARLDRLVDFGHTFSPVLEMTALPELLHGEAVAIDMAVSCALAVERELLGEPAFHEVLSTLRQLGLPLSHPACDRDLLVRGLEHSVRHRGGRQRLPVPAGVGNGVFLEGVTANDLGRALGRVHRAEAVLDARP